MAGRFNEKKAAEHGYTRQDWDAVSDNPPVTKQDMARAKPFRDALPELYESIQKSRGRPPVANPKQQVSLRLSPDVLSRLKASGKGWQSRVDDILRKAVGL